MKKVLIISYYFPPLYYGTTGRIIKLLRYISEQGWEPVVLTVKQNLSRPNAPSLLAEIPSNIRVYRTACFEPYRRQDTRIDSQPEKRPRAGAARDAIRMAELLTIRFMACPRMM